MGQCRTQRDWEPEDGEKGERRNDVGFMLLGMRLQIGIEEGDWTNVSTRARIGFKREDL